MDERKWLAERFEERRPRLRAVAYRMLGSLSEAEDAVQEAWLRVSGAAYGEIDDLGAWLTTVVARIALNMLRSRKTRSETRDARSDHRPRGRNRARSTQRCWPIRSALRWPWCSRPLRRPSASRSCCTTSSECPSRRSRPSSSAPLRRLANWPAAHAAMSRRGRATPDADVEVQRSVVAAFVAAARDGDFHRLVAVARPGGGPPRRCGPQAGGSIEVRGAEQVARRAQASRALGVIRLPVLVNGAAGLVCMLEGKPFSVMAFTVRGGKIAEIDILRDPERLSQLDLTVLDG